MASAEPLSYLLFVWLQEVLKVLLKHAASVDKQTSAGKDKLTPLMLAAHRGDLDTVRLLVQSGATVELLGQCLVVVVFFLFVFLDLFLF